ncbi:hypothetical protein ASH00_04035 [Arthrobacter sp. Soil782]|uniref:hypothetical protein n=1 Tax=Arthrobacter sp. Soil782 TaxID=1736410 RepID=UPI0006FCB688|nr:hypothetical protein [Arthrobacter sp. Soil782]KRF08860.1 hypothetical protein ASH00_04035 [Arthrobacter sp. Soil782]
MRTDSGWRKAIAVLAVGALLVVLGVFLVIGSQPAPTQDFGFVGGQGQEFHLTSNGVLSNGPLLFSPTMGGVLLGAGVALAAGVGGFVLGRRRLGSG